MPRDPAPASVIIHPFWAAAKVVRLPPSPSLSLVVVYEEKRISPGFRARASRGRSRSLAWAPFGANNNRRSSLRSAG